MSGFAATSNSSTHTATDEPLRGMHHDSALSLLGTVNVTLSVELGRQQMRIRELMELEHGRVIDLASAPDDALGVYVNGKLFAKGELVRVGSRFGIKVSELVGVDATKGKGDDND